jgi:hypothetical protein
MSWDGVGMADERGHRRAAADVLAGEFSSQDRTVVAVDANVANGRAYLAVRGADGQVRPVCLLLDPIDESGPAHPFLYYKDFPVDESPRRWPVKVAQALTTWEP